MMHVPAYIDPDHQSSPVIVDNCEIDPLLIMGIARARTIYSYWCLQFLQCVIGYISASLVHRAFCLMLEVRKFGSRNWPSTGGSSQRCPGFDSWQLQPFYFPHFCLITFKSFYLLLWYPSWDNSYMIWVLLYNFHFHTFTSIF